MEENSLEQRVVIFLFALQGLFKALKELKEENEKLKKELAKLRNES